MKKGKKTLFIVLSSIIVVLALIIAWLIGKDSTVQHSSQSVKTERVSSKVKSVKSQKSANSQSNTNFISKSSNSQSHNNPNEAFGQQLNNNDFLTLAYCKKWKYSLNDFLNLANENNNACLDQDSDAGDFHGVSINQGTGDSLCELTSINSNTITISGGNPVSQSDFHNLVYNKQDLVNEFLHSSNDVQTLKQLTNKLISNDQESKQEVQDAENDNDNNDNDNNDNDNIDNEAYHFNNQNVITDYSI